MPPAACHSPAPGQPSPADDAPPPGRAWKKCQMNGRPAGSAVGCGAARVASLDRDAEAAAPAGHRALGAGRRQRLDDRLEDLLGAVVGRQRDRRAGIGPDHGAGFGDDLERAEGAVVFRRVRVDQVGQRDDDRRIHVGVGRIDKARDLRMRVAEVDLQVAARFRDRRADMDVLVAAPVVVEHRLAEIDPVPPLRDDRAGLPLGAVEHGFDRGVRRLPAEFVRQRQKAPLADMRRADHRREVAAEIARVADIGRDHLHHVAPDLAAVVELQGRDAEAFLPDVGRRRRCRRRASRRRYRSDAPG